MDGRVEVAVERAPRIDARGVPGAIELELIDAVLPDHLEAGVAEALVVLGPREHEAARILLEPLRATGGEPLLARLSVSAPRRHPHARCRTETRSRFAYAREAVRKAGVEVPERRVIVPPIVEQERAQRDAPLLGELGAERLDHRERARFIVRREVAEVVPRVVVQEGAVGMRPLALHVLEEVATQ